MSVDTQERNDQEPGARRRLTSSVKRRMTQLFERMLVAYWRRREPLVVRPRPMSTSLADNVQSSMNLIMPLADQTAVGRANAVNAVGSAVDELFSGLNAVGTVHFARFDIVDGNLCMFSVYDGDFTSYIRDFIALFGNVFDALMEIVADPPPLPSERNPEAFIEWVHRHDAFQLPRDLTTMLPGLTDVRNLPRQVVLAVDANPNLQLGIYRGYPGSSVAQIRHALGVGW
jgi:hypothetical protein